MKATIKLALGVLVIGTGVALAQVEPAQLVGRTCIRSYDINGFKGTVLVRFLASDQAGTVRVEQYRITDANHAKLAQANGGAYDVSSPERIKLEDWELFRTHVAVIDRSKTGDLDYPIIGQVSPNEWRARLVGDTLVTRSIQQDRSDPKLGGIVGILSNNTAKCTSPR